jgi:hypothetical protein
MGINHSEHWAIQNGCTDREGSIPNFHQIHDILALNGAENFEGLQANHEDSG